MKQNVTIKILFVTSIHGSGRKQGTLKQGDWGEFNARGLFK